MDTTKYTVITSQMRDKDAQLMMEALREWEAPTPQYDLALPTGFVSYNGIEHVIIGDDGTNIDIVPLPDNAKAITVPKDQATPIEPVDIMSKQYRNMENIAYESEPHVPQSERKPCPKCDGEGMVAGPRDLGDSDRSTATSCSECAGRGWIQHKRENDR